MKEFLLWMLNVLGLAYWVEIVTESPRCTYYFGPFISSEEAQMAKSGYTEDLQQEKAQGITVVIKRTKPDKLTIFDEEEKEQMQPFRSRRVASLGSSVS